MTNIFHLAKMGIGWWLSSCFVNNQISSLGLVDNLNQSHNSFYTVERLNHSLELFCPSLHVLIRVQFT